MKRDMDLIRRIVKATADLPPNEQLSQLDGVDQSEYVMHVIWLKEAGLLHAVTPSGDLGQCHFAIVSRLTWDGCELADAMESDTLWEKAKQNVIRPGLSFTFDALREWLKAEISQGLPTMRTLG